MDASNGKAVVKNCHYFSFMYCGEVCIGVDEQADFLKAAERLEVRGLVHKRRDVRQVATQEKGPSVVDQARHEANRHLASGQQPELAPTSAPKSKDRPAVPAPMPPSAPSSLASPSPTELAANSTPKRKVIPGRPVPPHMPV